MTWLEQDRKRWRGVRSEARWSLALTIVFWIWPLIGLGSAALAWAPVFFHHDHGTITCNPDGTGTMTNFHIDLTRAQIESNDFIHSMQDVCRAQPGYVRPENRGTA